MAAFRSAWCPAGRTAQKALATWPVITRSTARTAAPAARGIDSNQAPVRRLRGERLDMPGGMGALELSPGRQRRIMVHQEIHDPVRLQPIFDARQPARRIRVTFRHDVFLEDRMRNVGGRHLYPRLSHNDSQSTGILGPPDRLSREIA
jgi:hypothetical protein